jgi:hypothetical protein
MDLLEAILSMAAHQRKALAEPSQNRCWRWVKAGLDRREGDQCARTTHGNEDTDDLGPDRWPNLHLSCD